MDMQKEKLQTEKKLEEAKAFSSSIKQLLGVQNDTEAINQFNMLVQDLDKSQVLIKQICKRYKLNAETASYEDIEKALFGGGRRNSAQKHWLDEYLLFCDYNY